MNNDHDNHNEADACPKRVWVLSTLSDDEQVGVGEAVPPGLSFHLSRCASCRLLADELLGVHAAIGAAVSTEVPQGLAERAASAAMLAIERGASLTGRVEIPDEPDVVAPASSVRARFWVRALAAAAMVAFASALVGLGWLGLRDSADELPVGGSGSGIVAIPAPTEGPIDDIGTAQGVPAHRVATTRPAERGLSVLKRPRSYDEVADTEDTSAAFQHAVLLRVQKNDARSLLDFIDMAYHVGSTTDQSDK